MSPDLGESRGQQVLLAAALSAVLIVSIHLLTNSLDTAKFSWDFRYYIGMAQNAFDAPQASPFAYRYVTPLLVYGLGKAFGVSVQTGFTSIAYIGAFLQLLGTFLFARWFTGFAKGAYVAMLTTAFSLFNVKFLLFDVYRPDHLAYALILLQSYLALKRKFLPLLLTTVVASQIREFNIIPLIAYLVAFSRTTGSVSPGRPAPTGRVQAIASVLALVVAVGLPRVLIPVTEDFQFADLTRGGLLRMLLAPLVLSRDANFIYSLIAYALPLLMIAVLPEIRAAVEPLSAEVKTFFLTYVCLVLAFDFWGGTDFFRFSTYLFIPQAVLIALVVQRRTAMAIAAILVAVFIFNRLWLPFPASDAGTYVDFYGGYGTRFEWASVLRIVECLAWIGLSLLVRKVASLCSREPPPRCS